MYPTPEGVGFIAPPRPSPIFITNSSKIGFRNRLLKKGIVMPYQIKRPIRVSQQIVFNFLKTMQKNTTVIESTTKKTISMV